MKKVETAKKNDDQKISDRLKILGSNYPRKTPNLMIWYFICQKPNPWPPDEEVKLAGEKNWSKWKKFGTIKKI